jgi:hypothetical protein
METKNKHRMRSDAAPARKIPFRAQKTDFRFQREIENLASFAAVESLRHLEQRQFPPVLAVRRPPHGNIHGFLLDLILDEHRAEKRASPTRGDFVRLPFPIRSQASVGRDQIEFHGLVRS